jgi:hypothetical protein
VIIFTGIIAAVMICRMNISPGGERRYPPGYLR